AHPRSRRWSRISASVAERLKDQGRPLAVLSPFREGATEQARFYEGDAFYLPFSGFGAMDRGGPIVTVWDLGGLHPGSDDEPHVLGNGDEHEPEPPVRGGPRP